MRIDSSRSLGFEKFRNQKNISKIFQYFKNLKSDGQKVRFYIQAGFLLLILWIGYEFYGFVQYHQSGGVTSYFSRPPGVEGFLPISALISLKYWVMTGIINSELVTTPLKQTWANKKPLDPYLFELQRIMSG